MYQAQQPQCIRPIMSREAMKATLGGMNGMSREEQNAALAPDAELGIELRRAVISNFVETRRMARSMAAVREYNHEVMRKLHRKISKMERSEYAFLKVADMMDCREKLLKLKRSNADSINLCGEIGASLAQLAALMEFLLPRELVLDLLEVGGETKDWLARRENKLSIYEIMRAGFANEAARSKHYRGIEPLMFCLHRADRAPGVAPKIEASHEEFDALKFKIDEYRARVVTTFALARAAFNEPRHKIYAARVAAVEALLALWKELSPVLATSAKGFSLAQKLALLDARDDAIEGVDVPEGASLLELIALRVEKPIPSSKERDEEERAEGYFCMIAIMCSVTEMRDFLQFLRDATTVDAETALAYESNCIENGEVLDATGVPIIRAALAGNVALAKSYLVH
jgi:hypothetical protein